jgi:hypothetical protein
VTAATQTGLPCSVLLLVRVLLPVPRQDRRIAPALVSSVLPSPWHDRLGSRIVYLSRLQASLDVAARVLAPSLEAFDIPLRRRNLFRSTGICYPALRRLPGRDSHPLEKHSEKVLVLSDGHLRHGAPCRDASILVQ